jgi:hypothetical protein
MNTLYITSITAQNKTGSYKIDYKKIGWAEQSQTGYIFRLPMTDFGNISVPFVVYRGLLGNIPTGAQI